MPDRQHRLRNARGFTLIDTLAVVAVFATLAAMAVPSLQDLVDNMRLGMALRDVERDLQDARLKAVSTNRPMRVRFNCPIAGQFRVVELIGSPNIPAAADTAANRCDETVYPYRSTGSDTSRLTRPNNDGPLRRLQPSASFTASQTLEFRPDGTVHADAGTGNPWPVLPAAGATLTVTRKSKAKNIKVNALGKIQMDR
jgi:Tfp pilus assembly protein FimT